MTAVPVRSDLMALDADGLAALTNRGLVKRAAREVDREPPQISGGPGATVIAEFGDGVRAELPVGGLERGACSCGAITVCRHLLGLVLAYQKAAAGPVPGDAPPGARVDAPPDGSPDEARRESPGTRPDAPPDTSPGSSPGAVTGTPSGIPSGISPGPTTAAGAGDGGARADVGWSPGAFSDAELVARIGTRLVEAARRAERAGYTARVRRGAAPVVELASATVRFLVPHDLGYVHTDARAGVRDDVIALAVWAFRAADAADATSAECLVDVGGARGGKADQGSGLEAVVDFAAEVLRAGVVHAGEGLAAAAAGHVSRLERAGLRWPLDAAAELADQLAAYRERSARYSPAATADLISELFARHRAAEAGARSRVLGSEEAAETPLRRVRLDGLGARVTAVDDQRRVEIFHLQAATGVVLVSQRTWTSDDDGPALARRRLGGASIGALAGGILVTESAVRSASRVVRLTTSRVSKSTVTIGTGAWDTLPPHLLIRDYARLAADLGRLPPRPVRARVRADLVRILAVAEVRGVHYSPGAQRLTVDIRDTEGVTATVTATHAAVAPARLDAIAAAFSGHHGTPRFVAGSVHRGGGGLLIDPYAIAAGGRVIVPDLTAPPTGSGGGGRTTVGPGPGPGDGPLGAAVAEAREVLADLAHSGLAHLSPSTAVRLGEARQAVARVGLHRIAAALDELTGRLGPDPGAAATTAWVDAYLRVGVAAELL
jgi:hypothetical protein